LPPPTDIHNLRHEPMIPDVRNASCRAMEINAKKWSTTRSFYLLWPWFVYD
jgi:hypothetical protein